MDVPLLMLDKTWTSNPQTEFEDPIDCDIFDMVSLICLDLTTQPSDTIMLKRI